MFTHTLKHKAEIALLQQKIQLLKAQLQHEKYLTRIERERYKKTVLINNRLVGKNLQLREIVKTVAPELGACDWGIVGTGERQLTIPDVSKLVCPTHGTKLYKHPDGMAYCSLCNYSIQWQTCC